VLLEQADPVLDAARFADPLLAPLDAARYRHQRRELGVSRARIAANLTAAVDRLTGLAVPRRRVDPRKTRVSRLAAGRARCEGAAMTTTTPRELAHRVTDGIEVSLRWDPAADRVSVQVLDAKTDEAFEIDVRPDERALDVFHHPYAYAALRRTQSRSTGLALTG
jgi:hypothetical protein